MRYPLLDPLRGIAAVWVLLHHLVFAFEETGTPRLLRLGYFGVPMFFVISGFCLTAAGRRAVRTAEPPGRFALRRAVRIYPPFWGAVAVAAAVYLLLLPLVGPPLCPFEEYVRDRWHSVGPREWVGHLTLLSAFRPAAGLPWDKFQPVNPVFWTLAVEVQFYAVVWVAVRARERFYALLAAVTAVSLPFAVSPAAFSGGWFLPFWPFFALGIGLYAALERGRTAGAVIGKFGRLVVLLGGAGLIAWGLALAPPSPDGGRAMMAGEFLFALGFAALLWLFWRPTERDRRIGGVLGYLGATSYSLYLLHIPLLLLAAHAVAPLFRPGSPAFAAAVVAAVCVLVYPFYRWVERPCLTSGRVAPARCAG